MRFCFYSHKRENHVLVGSGNAYPQVCDQGEKEGSYQSQIGEKVEITLAKA